MAEPAGVVFDCDGTLVDTEVLTRACEEAVLADMGLELTDEHHAAMVGRAWPESSAVLRDQVGVTDLDLYLSELRRRWVERFDEVAVFADAVDTALALAADGVPVAMCTSSGRVHVDRVLGGLDVGRVPFGAIVTREDTDEHKPRPAPYLLAAARLGADPTRCVAVEDSPTGATSALAAGMAVVVVDHDQHDLAGFTDLDVTITRHLTPAVVREVAVTQR